MNSNDPKAGEPVRVENAWPALVSPETFEAVQQGLHERAPNRQRPAWVGSQYLLSGLLRCGVCGKPYSGPAAKSGKFAYCVCASLFREGAGACRSGRFPNAGKVEDYIIDKIRERILTEETITELVTLVAEEIDALAGEVNGRLTAIAAELADVESRSENLYQALETKQLPIEALSPRILSLKSRQDQLAAAREEARTSWSGGGRTCPPARRSRLASQTSARSSRMGLSRSARPSFVTWCRASKSWTTRPN